MAEGDIVVLTDYSSPYQVELFDLIEKMAPGRLEVFYRTRTSTLRGWSQPELGHKYHSLDAGPAVMKLAEERFSQAQLAVFNYYTDRRALRLIDQRATLKRPWVFWGERPGYVSPTYGRFFRLWALRALHRSRAPVWGIGQMAVESYRSEFGAHRQYVNLPYFSDLQRFQEAAKRKRLSPGEPRVVLYSGSLIYRKGVDLLARAFARLNESGSIPNLRLKILGRGELEKSMRKQLSRCLDKVDFVGFKDWNDLPKEYGDAHFLCAPSRHDGWGLIIPEGLASGLPVIGTQATGAACEFIANDCNGWLIPADSEEALLSALMQSATISDQMLNVMSSSASITVEHLTLLNGAKRFLQAADDAVCGW